MEPKRKSLGSEPSGSWDFAFQYLGCLLHVEPFTNLRPRLQASPSGSWSPINAMSAYFDLVNSGYMDASDLRLSWVFKNAEFGASLHNVELTIAGIGKLGPGEKSTVPLAPGFHLYNKPGRADATLHVWYKIRRLRLVGELEYSQRFVSITNVSGFVQWAAVSSN